MAQIAKVIDVTRSFIPVDPNAFPQNLMYTVQEDFPEKEPPILAIEGHNFLPTSYGYRSYFGFNSSLNIQNLPSRCDKVLLFQLANYKNVLIALCEDGIYYAAANTDNSTWTKAVSYSYDPLIYRQWTYALIENTLYFYRQGAGEVWKLSYTDYTETSSSSSLISFTSFTGTTVLGFGTDTNPYLVSLSNNEYANIYNNTSISIFISLELTGTVLNAPLAIIYVTSGLDGDTIDIQHTANSFPYTTAVEVPPFGYMSIKAKQDISDILAIATNPVTTLFTWDAPANYVPVSISYLNSDAPILGIGTVDDPFRTDSNSMIYEIQWLFPMDIVPVIHINTNPSNINYILEVTNLYGDTSTIATGFDITGSYSIPVAGPSVRLIMGDGSLPFSLVSVYFTLQ